MAASGWRAALKRWRQTTRWPYVVLALLAFPFIGHAYEDAGIVYGGIYGGVTVLGLLQAIWPTIVGWLCLFLILLFYATLGIVGASGAVEMVGEFILVSALLGGAFWFIRPWKQWPGRTSKQSASRDRDA